MSALQVELCHLFDLQNLSLVAHPISREVPISASTPGAVIGWKSLALFHYRKEDMEPGSLTW
ncbi:MAG: hypothetical protein ABJA70_23985, partial [Chryseolinea sp.]